MAPPPARPSAPTSGAPAVDRPEIALPWLECEHLSFAWGMQHRGTVVDRDGAVATYEGGPPVRADGVTAAELSAKVAHGRRELGAVDRDELREVRAWVGEAVAAPVRRQGRMVYDGPTDVCRVYLAEEGGGLRAVELERSDTKEHAVREGEAAARLLAWLKGLSAMAPTRR